MSRSSVSVKGSFIRNYSYAKIEGVDGDYDGEGNLDLKVVLFSGDIKEIILNKDVYFKVLPSEYVRLNLSNQTKKREEGSNLVCSGPLYINISFEEQHLHPGDIIRINWRGSSTDTAIYPDEVILVNKNENM